MIFLGKLTYLIELMTVTIRYLAVTTTKPDVSNSIPDLGLIKLERLAVHQNHLHYGNHCMDYSRPRRRRYC